MQSGASYAPKSFSVILGCLGWVLLALTLNSCDGDSPSEPTPACPVVFTLGQGSEFFRVINRTSGRINVDFFRSPHFISRQTDMESGECASHRLQVNSYNISIQRLPGGPVIFRSFTLDRNETETMTLRNDDF
jgi:hypothetical protein